MNYKNVFIVQENVGLEGMSVLTGLKIFFNINGSGYENLSNDRNFNKHIKDTHITNSQFTLISEQKTKILFFVLFRSY